MKWLATILVSLLGPEFERIQFSSQHLCSCCSDRIEYDSRGVRGFGLLYARTLASQLLIWMVFFLINHVWPNPRRQKYIENNSNEYYSNCPALTPHIQRTLRAQWYFTGLNQNMLSDKTWSSIIDLLTSRLNTMTNLLQHNFHAVYTYRPKVKHSLLLTNSQKLRVHAWSLSRHAHTSFIEIITHPSYPPSSAVSW